MTPSPRLIAVPLELLGGESRPVTVCFLSRRLEGTISLQRSQQLREVTDERAKVDPASSTVQRPPEATTPLCSPAPE